MQGVTLYAKAPAKSVRVFTELAALIQRPKARCCTTFGLADRLTGLRPAWADVALSISVNPALGQAVPEPPAVETPFPHTLLPLTEAVAVAWLVVGSPAPVARGNNRFTDVRTKHRAPSLGADLRGHALGLYHHRITRCGRTRDRRDGDGCDGQSSHGSKSITVAVATSRRREAAPPQNLVDRTVVDVCSLGVKLTYPDASLAARTARGQGACRPRFAVVEPSVTHVGVGVPSAGSPSPSSPLTSRDGQGFEERQPFVTCIA